MSEDGSLYGQGGVDVPVGRVVERPVSSLSDQGAMVDCGVHGDLFVPRSQLPRYIKEGDLIRVFLYQDGGRILATARKPLLELGMAGRLRVDSVECGTAYLDLGIPKELVVPISEQRTEFEPGDMVPIFVAMDDLGRLFGTQRFNRYIHELPLRGRYRRFDKVKCVPVSRTPLGWRAVIDDDCYGVMYRDNEKGEVDLGRRYDGYIIMIRPDGRLDVSLQEPGAAGVEHAALVLMQALERSNGQLGFNDRSDPGEIEDYLHMSKGKFKKAIGHLYKLRLIEILEDGIRLTSKGHEEIESRISGAKRGEIANEESDEAASEREELEQVEKKEGADAQ
ncbi:MAG: S1 RNA-binding domain-containing protein [Succinivibrio sp.]